VAEDQQKRARGTREETTEAMLDAAEELFAQRGYTAVTVREIAAAAGVSHALVHRYLGAKEDVYRAMLQRRETVIRDAAPGEDDLLAATRLMLEEALRQRRYLRLIAHSALHGLPYSRTSGRFAATERLVELAKDAAEQEPLPDAPDPRFVIASVVALLLGWNATRDWLVPAAGIEEMGEDELHGALERIILDLERLYFPSVRDTSD
jgi:AcrR family transcriptional regulator